MIIISFIKRTINRSKMIFCAKNSDHAFKSIIGSHNSVRMILMKPKRNSNLNYTIQNIVIGRLGSVQVDSSGLNATISLNSIDLWLSEWQVYKCICLRLSYNSTEWEILITLHVKWIRCSWYMLIHVCRSLVLSGQALWGNLLKFLSVFRL